MGDTLSSIGSGLGSAANSVGSAIGTGVSDIGSAIGTGFGDIGSLFSGSGAGAGGGAPSVAGAAAPASAITQSALPDITSAAPVSAGGAASAASAIPNATGAVDPSTFQSVTSATAIPQVNLNTGPMENVPGITQSPNVLQQLMNPNLLKAGVLGLDLVNANKLPAGAQSLKNLANQEGQLASTYGKESQAEGQGLLPAGAEALVQNSLNAQIAAIKGKYSQMGMSGSTAEIQDVNAAKSQALAQTFQIGNTLAQQGLQEVQSATGLQSQLLQQVLAAETAQGTELGNALASFAGAATK